MLITVLMTAAGVGFLFKVRRCCASVSALWLDRGVGDKEGDGEGSASMPGRKSCRMLGSCSRSMYGSTFWTADVTMSWKISTCTVAVDEGVDFELGDDGEEARSVGDGTHVGSWRRRFGGGESGVKLVRARRCASAIYWCCVRLEDLLCLERLFDTCAYEGGASYIASSKGGAPATASSIEGTALDVQSPVGR